MSATLLLIKIMILSNYKMLGIEYVVNSLTLVLQKRKQIIQQT